MSREIKFRGMSIRGTWYYGLICKVEEGTFISNSVGRPMALEIRPETICQFTGLKDKNGKEIFEGDIILEHHSGIKYKIFYEDGCFGNSTTQLCNDSINEYEIEVIGNIHENPELLGEKE